MSSSSVNGVTVYSRKIGTAGVDSKWLKSALARQELLEKKLVGDEAKKEINETLDMQDTPEKDL